MYQVYFYKTPNGDQPVLDYLTDLLSKKDKDSRIKANKINDYIQILSEYGTRAGEPYMKHIDGFVLLHQLMKKSQKTPLREIEKAKREFADLTERGLSNE